MMPTELSAVLPARHIQEECGVFGVYAPETTDVALPRTEDLDSL